MEKCAWFLSFALLTGCAAPGAQPTRHAQPAGANAEAGAAATEACKSALALRSGVNAVYVLPISHVPYGNGQEVFLSLHQAQWLCTTDSRGNVNRLERR